MNSLTNKRLLFFLPALVGTLLYFTTVDHGFVLDDNLVITRNVTVQKGISAIPELLTTNYANGHQGKDFNDGLYRPLSLISFAIEASFLDLNPSVSHVIQALIYGLLLIALMLWLQAFFPQENKLAFWICLLFAVHPIHTEVVANLKSRDELFALLFFSLSAWQFLKWLSSQQQKHLFLTLTLFLLALFSKESSVTFLAVFPLVLWMKKADKSKWLSSLSLLAPVILFLFIRQWVLNEMGPVDSGVTGLLQNVLTTSDSLGNRLATGAVIQGLYFSKLFLPINLASDYSYKAIALHGLGDLKAIVWIILVAATLAAGFYGLVKRKFWGFGVVFYFITISVVANVFVLIGALAAERFVFAPSLGWSIAIVFGVSHLPWQRKYNAWLLGVVCVLFGWLTLTRIPDWKDEYTLFTTDVERVPQSARAHYNAGSAANDRAKADPANSITLRSYAEQHLRKAIEIWPDYQDAYNNLGVVYIDGGNWDNAYRIYSALTDRFPDYGKGQFNLAYTCYQMKRYAEAERLFEQYNNNAVNPDALYLLAECEGYQNKFDEARVHLEQLIQLEPNRARTYLKLGMAYAIGGNTQKAEEIFLQGINVASREAELHFNLALVYYNSGRIQRAKESLKDALSINPDFQRAQQLLNDLK